MKTYSLKLVGLIILLLNFSTGYGQLTGSITPTLPVVCLGEVHIITFNASGGTAPYTFNYQINNQNPETITTNGQDSAVSITLPATQAGVIVIQLISVADNNSTNTVNQSMTIITNPIPIVDAGPDIFVCSGNVVTMTASGAMSYSWDHGVVNGVPTTVDSTALFTVVGVDANGCSNIDQVLVTVVPNDPPQMTAVIDSAACSDGLIILSVNGPHPPYALEWDNGATTAINSPLEAGSYTATVTDSLGCTFQQVYVVPSSQLPTNCGSVSGYVHYDSELDCQIGQGDLPVLNRMIVANPGNYTTFTDGDGYYEFNLNPGSYTITEYFNNSNLGSSCTAIHSVNIVSQSAITDQNFMDTIAGGFDFQAQLTVGQIRPLFPVDLYISISEAIGATEMNNLSAWFTLPQGIDFLSWNHPHTISNDTVFFQIVNGTSFNSHISLVNTGSQLGDTVIFCIGVELVPNETDILNNVFCQSNIVIGSYDPNDITLFLDGKQQDSTILLTDAVLDYRIRFQNTGTADAINIFVLDTISEYLDFSSFQLISTSHHCELSVLDNNVLKFYFPQIHLPDSTTNEPESHGYINYRIRQKASNQVGDVILNTAYIYFDFNEPVITNTAYNEIVEEVLSVNSLKNEMDLIVFPNPGRNEFTISGDLQGESIQVSVHDLQGNMAHTELIGFNNNTAKLKLDVKSGVYFIHMMNPVTNQKSVKKIIVL
jgi:uncharacterized repeat protein (TIGR01451 family)